jgi:type II secretory pathway component GspD/PulD (secretin)
MFAKEAFFSWGISLSVTPRISPDGLISVEIVPTISDCTDYVTVNSSQESDTPYTQYPIIEVKRLTTEFTMKDGATAVIGGLSKAREEDVDSGIPYLRHIPWIGPKLFGWKSRQKVQTEILVFVTVGIANPEALPKDIGLPKNAILGREYVQGSKLEPGDREGAADKVLALDMDPIDRPKQGKGTVTVTPSQSRK